jgi:hypothetical protein
MRIYIAGPMAGLPDHNIPAFDAAAKRLTMLGHTFANPADNARKLATQAGLSVEAYRAGFTDTGWRAHIYKYDFIELLQCDGIVLLTGWHKSKGATLEALLARQLDLKFFQWDPCTVEPEKLLDITDAIASAEQFTQRHLETLSGIHIGSASKQLKGDPMESVCLEADRLVDGARQHAYGHPLDNYDRVAALWEDYVNGKYAPKSSIALCAEDIAQMMILLKVGRLENGYHRDSLVDIAGYAKVHDMIHTERERRNNT